MHTWSLAGNRSLPLDRPRLMTILNCTPDSFSDGGNLDSIQDVIAAARRAVEAGADMLDIGGESTRPGAARVSAEQQTRRTAPAIEAIRAAGLDIPISIDTTRAETAAAALDAGADAINDVSGATEDPAMLTLAAERSCGIILMHRLTTPDRDAYSDRYETAPSYDAGVVEAVRAALAERLNAATAAGIDPEKIVLDPGLGFGKTVQQNLDLIDGTAELLTLGRPILAASSRKSFVGRVGALSEETNRPDGRLGASIAFSLVHLARGARIFRIHDTEAQAQALRTSWALQHQAR